MNVEETEFKQLFKSDVQYVVPQWQRRYRWGEKEISRLVEDLLNIAGEESTKNHYGGALIVVENGSAAGVVRSVRVVDGQQRLTTVSLLISAIAEFSEPEGTCDLQRLLINSGQPEEKRRKLRLQNGDEDQYRQCLIGKASEGAVADAYALIRNIVKSKSDKLLEGLRRFRVVRIGLKENDDPQQIFESLNATGIRLAESEKVKNWLLMPLSESAQKKAYQNWRAIEGDLNADLSTKPIDLFLRDLLRWKTGKLRGIGKVYEGFQEWAKEDCKSSDRLALAVDLARWARHYGVLTGTAGSHPNRKVERELIHLRGLGLDIHRPFTLRLLDEEEQKIIDSLDVARTLELVGIWLTRAWLADRRTSGYNKTFVEWAANRGGPREGKKVEVYWQEELYRLQNTRSAVPTDEEVKRGIATRTAYGGEIGISTRAVLCRMMEADHQEEAPDREKLTLEHIMPDKLTSKWKKDLGARADEIHDKWCHRLANLTLSGAERNVLLSNEPFDRKKSIYEKSSIGLTRELLKENHWNEEAMERRAASLTKRALLLWPWESRKAEYLPARRRTSEFRRRFWQTVRKETGGLLGQKDSWQGTSQWSSPVTPEKDRIGYSIAFASREVFLFIKRSVHTREDHRLLANRTQAMLDFSRHIRNEITDQTLGANEEKEAEQGRSIAIIRDWDPDDEGQWPEAARWLKEQQDRLLVILEKHVASR